MHAMHSESSAHPQCLANTHSIAHAPTLLAHARLDDEHPVMRLPCVNASQDRMAKKEQKKKQTQEKKKAKKRRKQKKEKFRQELLESLTLGQL